MTCIKLPNKVALGERQFGSYLWQRHRSQTSHQELNKQGAPLPRTLFGVFKIHHCHILYWSKLKFHAGMETHLLNVKNRLRQVLHWKKPGKAFQISMFSKCSHFCCVLLHRVQFPPCPNTVPRLRVVMNYAQTSFSKHLKIQLHLDTRQIGLFTWPI